AGIRISLNLLPQRHAGTPRLLSPTLPNLAAASQSDGGRRLLGPLEQRAGARQRTCASRLLARRSAAHARRSSATPPHTVKLLLGPKAAALARAGRLARSLEKAESRCASLPLVAHPLSSFPRAVSAR